MYTRGNAVRAAPAMLLAALMVFPIFSNPLAGGDGARPPPTPDNLWFFVPPTEKVGPNATYPNTSAVYNGTTILLSAARGEHEAFQFVYCVSYNRTGNLSLTAFTSDSGTIPTSCFEFYQVWYPTEALTEWPDPLIPILPNQTLNFTTLRNNVFLIDVFVPEATLPGIYRGNFSFDWQIKPVELTVWDITLPGKNTLQTWFDDSPSSWASAYGYAPWSSEHQELMKNVYARYKEFRLSPGNIDLGMVGRYNMSVSDGVVSVDFSGTDPWLEYCLDGLGFTSFRFPLTGYSPRRADMDASTGHPDGPYFWGAPPYDMNPLYADHIGQYIKQVADHYRQKGWLDKAYVYVTDEPIAFNNAVNSYWQHPDYHVVSEFYDLVKANAPDLKFINTAQPVPELFNYTDVWAVPGGYYHELDAGERISQNQSVWWYNVDAGIASDGVKGRALYWDTFSRGLQGVLYWGTNYWDYDTVNGDPWQGYNSNGDGYLFYPWNKVALMDNMCPSLRLFLARDGLEDFELLNLYGEKYGHEAARAVAESVAVGSSFAGARYRPVEDRTIYEIREWLASQITRQTADPAWTDTFLDEANVWSATDLVHDPAWEGSWALGPANPPFLVDNLDAIGGWRPNNQPHIFSGVSIDNAIKTEGAGSLRIDFWRDDDPGELGGYDNMRNGRVVTSSLALTDWSGFDLLEMDVRSVDHPAGNLYMLVGDAAGTVVSSDLHRYARYSGGPGDNWTHVVIDISGKSRSSIQYIKPIVYNYFLEVPYKHYSYWLDNITVRKAGSRGTGTLISKPIDLGPVGSFGDIERITQWYIPAGDPITFETRTSADSMTWSPWALATPSGHFRAAITSPPARYFQYRAIIATGGVPETVLSEVGVVYRPLQETDLFVANMTFDPLVPNDNETFNISVTAGNIGPSGVLGARVLFVAPSGPVANLSVDITSGEKASLSVKLSLPASAAGWPVFARISPPLEGWTDPVEANNEAAGIVRVNDFPQPVIYAPATALVGEVVPFDASGSSDAQGIDRYTWAFPDIELQGPVVNRTFAAAGLLPYALTVTDVHGASSSRDAAINVLNHTPVPSFVITPEKGTVRTAFTFISTVIDPENTVLNTTWLFGDGLAGFGRVVNHTFPDDRAYTVDCTVDFFENGSLRRATASGVLRIDNLPPAASFNATNFTAGKRKPVGFDATGSPDPDDELAEASFSWTFGDGICATGRMASHSWTRAGTFNVTLTLTDDDGASSSSVLPVTITNQLPVADFSLPANVTCNSSFALDASQSRDPDGVLVGYRWEFDDGTVVTGAVATHSFAIPGTRSVTLVVTDDDGGAGRLTRTSRAGPEARAPGRRTNPAPAAIHPGVWVGLALVAVMLVLFAVSRIRPRRDDVSRWTLARHVTGPGMPASARGPPPSVEPSPAINVGETSAAGPPAAPPAPGATPPPAAALEATPEMPAATTRQLPRVVRTIPPPPPRFVRSLPPPADAAVIDLESARPAKVIGLSASDKDPGRSPLVPDEPWRLGTGAPVKGQFETRTSRAKEPVRPAERKGEESDPTLPTNPWAERRT